MKKLIISIIVVTILASCEKTLQEVPRDFISRTNYYKNQSDAEGAINGVYSAFASDYGITFWLFQVLHSDYALGRGSQAPISIFNSILDQTNINRAATIWSSFYTTINRANSVLDNVPGIEGINEEVKQRILSEAHFFRALSYFNLVRGFGPVPIKIHESVDVSSVGSPREPESAVYDLILSDVLEAEKNLPSDVGAETGRLSVWSAKMLLAQIYLTLEQWSDAAAKAKEIMDSGVFELITVSQASDFYHIFATNTNAEYILALQQSETRQSSLPQFLHRPSTPPYNYSSSGFFAWLPDTTSFIGDAWDDADLRKSFNLYHSYIGPDGEMVSLPSSSPVLFGKFITTPDGIRSYSAPIFRLAETYLIYAEADAMATGSVTTEALEALNVIRRRAYGMDPHSASEIDYLGDVSVAEFQDLVLQEKAYEFIVEGQRWWDLKRTGKVEEAMTAADKEFRSERLLWPLPEDEINNNPDINQEDQNPGY